MPTDRSEMVQVVGLAELQKALKAINLEGELKPAHLEIAENVAAKARAKASSLGGVAAHAAPSIKARAEQRYAKINLGDNAHPEALGAEFGGRGRPTTQQFPPFTGRTGRFLYPTVRATQAETEARYNAALGKILERAFPD